MSFDDDYEELPDKKNKIGLKKVSSQESIFDNIPKKPSQNDLVEKVNNMTQKGDSFKARTADLAIKFKKIMEDKTLPQNKNIFAQDHEKEILSLILSLASEVNNDPNELEGMGSLSWIAQLFKTCLMQRDRINKIEYALFQLEKKIIENNKNLDVKNKDE